MKVVFASHSFFGPYFVVGSHHLARQFARRGHTVWHIAPIPFLQIFKPMSDYKIRTPRFFRGVVEIEPNLKEAIIRPFLPWQLTRAFLKTGNYFLHFSDIHLLIQTHPELKEADILIVDEPRLSGIEKYIRAKSIYYRPTDLYADTKNDKSIEETEAGLLALCNGLIATSEPVMERMLNLTKPIPNLVLTNGVDDNFSSVREEPLVVRNIGRPRVIYAGAIDERLDLEAIGFLARRLPTVQFLIVGQGARSEELRAMAGPNLHVLGPIPYAELSAVLQHCDVGLLPLAQSRPNAGRSPMKLYEYGLSGLSVLASHTLELSRRAEDFIHLYSNHEEAAQCLEKILSSTPDRAAISKQCAKQAWRQKAETLEKFITDTSKLPVMQKRSAND